MALDQSALLEVLEALKAADVEDRVRQATQTTYQALIEAELSEVIGAAPHERSEARGAYRNGARPRTLTAPAGDLEYPDALLRLAGAVLVEAHDEWQVTDRRYLAEASMALLETNTTPEEVATTQLAAS